MINITYEKSDIQKVADLIMKNSFYAFPDVEPNAWFSPYISIGKIDDHIHGYPETGEYIPWNEIEISEAVKILLNTARHDNRKVSEDLAAAEKDVGNDPWFMKYALLCYAYGGFTPVMDKDPGLIYSRKLSRQEAADIIFTTILNAGVQAKSKLSALKSDIAQIKKENGMVGGELVDVPLKPQEGDPVDEDTVATPAPELEEDEDGELRIIPAPEPYVPQYGENDDEEVEEVEFRSSVKDRIKRRNFGTPILF